MAEIYRIIVRCPATGSSIDTGIRTSGRESLNSRVYQQGSVVCKHCNQSHSFKEHAFLDVDQMRTRGRIWRPNQ